MDDWLRDRQAFERVLEALDGPDGAHLDDVRRARRLSLRDAVEVGRQIDVHDDDVAAAYVAINGFGAWRLSTPSELVEVRVVSSRPRRYMLDRRADPTPDGEQIVAWIAAHPGLPRWALPLAEQLLAKPDRPFLVVGQRAISPCYVGNRVVHGALAAAWTRASPRHCAEALEVTEKLEHEVPTESRLAGLAAYRQLDLVTWLVGGPRMDVNLRYLRWWACHRWSSLVAFCAPGWRETVLQAMGADVDEQLPRLQLGDGVELVDLDQTSGVDQTLARATRRVMKRLEDGSEEAKGVARALARKAWATPGGITIEDAFEAVQDGLREAGHELPERAINNALLRGLAFQFARLAWNAGFATVEDVARIVIHNMDEQAKFPFFPEPDALQIAVDALVERQKASDQDQTFGVSHAFGPGDEEGSHGAP